MFKNTEILDSTKHHALKLSPITEFSFAKQQNFAPISYTEIISASREYAIVFPKNIDNGKNALPVVLLGLTGTNHFVDEQGQWKGRYIPAHFRRYPFILGTSEQQDTFAVMIDTDSQYLSNEKGETLFGSDAKQTETLKQVVDFLSLFQKEAVLTMELVKTLRNAGVLIDQQINNKDQAVITGFEVVDPEKLNAIDDNQFIEWRKQGLLPLIYAHLASLDNIRLLS
jgi:putative transposase